MRTIEYTVGVDKINPFTVQFAGYAGEDNVTTLKFTLDSELMNIINSYASGIFYALEVRNSEGAYDVYPLKCDASGSSTVLQFTIPAEVTSLSGRAAIQLSVVKLDSRNIQERKLFTYPLRLRFEPSVSGGAEGVAEVEHYESGVVSAMRRAERAAEEADKSASYSAAYASATSEHADKATEAAEEAESTLRQLYETPVEINDTIIFNGGGAGSEFNADCVVDEELSERSENPVQNKTVSAALNLKADSDVVATIISELDYKAEKEDVDHDLSLKLDKSAVADYIIEQGTNGIWTYRKWNSGIAECWGIATGNTATNDDSSVPSSTTVELPFLFVTATQANIQPIRTSENGWRPERVIPDIYDNISEITFHSYCIAEEDSNSVVYSIEVRGTWK